MQNVPVLLQSGGKIMTTAELTMKNPAETVKLDAIMERVIQTERKKKIKNSVIAWGLLLPSLLFLALFTVYPIVQSLASSLYQDDLSTMEPIWNGLGNYVDLLKDPVFLECFRNRMSSAKSAHFYNLL